MLSGQAPDDNNLSSTDQTEWCYKAITSHPLNSLLCFHAQECIETTHIPKAERASRAFSILTDSLHTHTGHSSSLVLHHCRLSAPCTRGADTSPQAMRLINYSEFQRAAAPLGLQRAPLYSMLHQQEAAVLQPADTQDYYPLAQIVSFITKWWARLHIIISDNRLLQMSGSREKIRLTKLWRYSICLLLIVS